MSFSARYACIFSVVSMIGVFGDAAFSASKLALVAVRRDKGVVVAAGAIFGSISLKITEVVNMNLG